MKGEVLKGRKEFVIHLWPSHLQIPGSVPQYYPTIALEMQGPHQQIATHSPQSSSRNLQLSTSQNGGEEIEALKLLSFCKASDEEFAQISD